MKKSILLLLVAIFLASFTIIAKGDYTLTGTITGIDNGKKITLERQDEKGITILDSAKVIDGKFSFKGNTPEPGIYFIQVNGVQGKVAFILEEGKINFILYKDSIGKSKLGGTKNNEDLYNFNVTAMKIQKKMQDFQASNMTKFNEAQAKQDTATTNQIIKNFSKFQDELMNLSAAFPEKNPKSYLSILFIDNMFNNPKIEIEKIRKNYNALDQSLKNTKTGKTIKTKIDNYKSLEVGNPAPEFSAPNPEGKMLTLKESLGKITIIDFWASWCGPCRKDNPDVVALYNEFHSKGLNIIGVSLDKDDAKWKEAIAKDGLVWNHVSNLKFWQDPIAELYNIKSIPATFIVDENGKIIARDLRGEQLRAKIASLLNK